MAALIASKAREQIEHVALDGDLLDAKPSGPQIEQFQRLLLQAEANGHGAEIVTRHYFAPGVYAREVFIPAGTVLIGARHKTEHLVLFAGDITVWHEGHMVRITGHHTLVSKPQTKRVGFAHMDTYCTGFFPTSKTDVRELESDLVEESHLLQCNRRGIVFEDLPELIGGG